MIKELNNIIRRKNYQNFIKEGMFKMDYRISDIVTENAISCIEEESLKEGLGVLKNQIDFLTKDENQEFENTTLTNDEANVIKSNLNNINSCVDTLNFKKDALQANLDECLSVIDIAGAVKLKNELMDINAQLDKFNQQRDEIDSKIKSSRIDYDSQMIKIREKYNDIDIVSHSIEDDEFSSSVINSYKKERAVKIATQFLSKLTPEKQQQILSENEELNNLVNVGENF